jgi:hypothetical protein
MPAVWKTWLARQDFIVLGITVTAYMLPSEPLHSAAVIPL